MSKRKKGQEEIMGFMLVVIMVMMIGLAFLFFMTPKKAETQDLELKNLLYSWKSANAEGRSIESIIKDCNPESCQLNSSIAALDFVISKTGLINRINGYNLEISGNTKFSYSKGNLTGDKKASTPLLLGDNTVILRFYYP